jgi:hypothetical protein
VIPIANAVVQADDIDAAHIMAGMRHSLLRESFSLKSDDDIRSAAGDSIPSYLLESDEFLMLDQLQRLSRRTVLLGVSSACCEAV